MTTTILAALTEHGKLTVPGLAQATGLAPAAITRALRPLVTAGTVTREVHREWEKQRGVSWKFGGAAVCQRRRAYFFVAPKEAQ